MQFIRSLKRVAGSDIDNEFLIKRLIRAVASS
jgi:hypothetical protein